jgi:hypothetical protein
MLNVARSCGTGCKLVSDKIQSHAHSPRERDLCIRACVWRGEPASVVATDDYDHGIVYP